MSSSFTLWSNWVTYAFFCRGFRQISHYQFFCLHEIWPELNGAYLVSVVSQLSYTETWSFAYPLVITIYFRLIMSIVYKKFYSFLPLFHASCFCQNLLLFILYINQQNFIIRIILNNLFFNFNAIWFFTKWFTYQPCWATYKTLP